MIIYNVTLKLEKDVAEAWVHWMKTVHMDDVMNTGLFTNCRLCRLLEQDEADGITYSAQYYCENIDQYHRYIEHHSKEKREKLIEKFGGKFVAFRSVMEVI